MSEEIDRRKFLNYFQTFTTFNGDEYDEILVHLHNYAIKYGLEEYDMSLVSTISFKQNLGFMRIRKLLKCLIPRRYCSEITVKLILNQLIKYRDGSPLLVKQFLQWLNGVIEYNLIESLDEINSYYHFFVYFLKFEIIDIPATKLLYFLTQTDDVTKRFTEHIRTFYKATNKAKHFGALLYLFKSYRPDVVPGNIPMYSPHKSFGNTSNGILENLLCTKTRITKNYAGTTGLNNNVWNKFGMETIYKTSGGIGLLHDKYIPMKDVGKLHTFIASSNETCSVLSLLNNAAGMYLIMFGSKILHERLSYQLYFVLYDAFLDRNPLVSSVERENILEKVASLQNILQQPIPVVSKFIGQYLMRWDGLEHQKYIFNIIEWLHVKSFTELRHCVLMYLLLIFKCGTIKTKCRILFCLGNFTVNIILTYIQREIKNEPAKYFDIKEEYSFPEFIKELFLFLENLCLMGILLDKNNPAILNSVIFIHRNILRAGKRAGINFKISKNIPYTALFFHIPNALNAVCRLINEFPTCVSLTIKQDFVNCLLNNKGFTPTSKGSIFYDFDENKYLIPNIETRLHLERHYAFFCYTYLINNKTSREEIEKILNEMERKNLDVFRFLKEYA